MESRWRMGLPAPGSGKTSVLSKQADTPSVHSPAGLLEHQRLGPAHLGPRPVFRPRRVGQQANRLQIPPLYDTEHCLCGLVGFSTVGHTQWSFLSSPLLEERKWEFGARRNGMDKVIVEKMGFCSGICSCLTTAASKFTWQ